MSPAALSTPKPSNLKVESSQTRRREIGDSAERAEFPEIALPSAFRAAYKLEELPHRSATSFRTKCSRLDASRDCLRRL